MGAKQGPIDSFLARKTPSGNSQEYLDLEEKSTEAILIFVLLLGLHFLGPTNEPRLDNQNLSTEYSTKYKYGILNK